MITTNSESESRELHRSDEDDERTENGYSHEENGNGNGNGNGGPASWPASSRAENPPSPLTLAFPISRVRRIAKSGGDTQWVGVEAGFLITKATEIFLEKMVEDTFERMQDTRQESILYPHLSSHVASSERLEFLADFVPMKIPAPTALSNAQSTKK